MSSEQMRITVPLTILTMVVSLIIGIIGWIINDKLTTIASSLKDLKNEIVLLTDNKYDHETRLRLLEDKVGLINSQKLKK